MVTPLEIFVFLAAALGIVFASRASLLAPRAHGFYRFFAWEIILALVMLNLRSWFHNPFSWHQILSWLLLTASLFPVFLGMRMLRLAGKPDSQRVEVPLVGIEKTTALVTTGIYRYIRHPLYASLLLLTWGVFFKEPGWLNGLLALAATGFLLVTAWVEERENLAYFGEAYRVYMRHTRRFIPFVF
jgi:protein-S-isoprenylcysteine O-methyltransferase Ste14